MAIQIVRCLLLSVGEQTASVAVRELPFEVLSLMFGFAQFENSPYYSGQRISKASCNHREAHQLLSHNTCAPESWYKLCCQLWKRLESINESTPATLPGISSRKLARRWISSQLWPSTRLSTTASILVTEVCQWWEMPWWMQKREDKQAHHGSENDNS